MSTVHMKLIFFETLGDDKDKMSNNLDSFMKNFVGDIIYFLEYRTHNEIDCRYNFRVKNDINRTCIYLSLYSVELTMDDLKPIVERFNNFPDKIFDLILLEGKLIGREPYRISISKEEYYSVNFNRSDMTELEYQINDLQRKYRMEEDKAKSFVMRAQIYVKSLLNEKDLPAFDDAFCKVPQDKIDMRNCFLCELVRDFTFNIVLCDTRYRLLRDFTCNFVLCEPFSRYPQREPAITTKRGFLLEGQYKTCAQILGNMDYPREFYNKKIQKLYDDTNVKIYDWKTLEEFCELTYRSLKKFREEEGL